jgi:hypothetical protein
MGKAERRLRQKQKELEAATSAGATDDAAAAPARVLSDGEGKTVYLMRHGETNHNVLNNDEHDTVLTERGVQQTSSWRMHALHAFPDAEVVLLSPLRRTIQTGLFAFQDTQLPYRLCPTARELWWSEAQCRGVAMEELAEFVDDLPRGDAVGGWEELEEGAASQAWDPEREARMAAKESDALHAEARASASKLASVLGQQPEKTIVVCRQVLHAFIHYEAAY